MLRGGAPSGTTINVYSPLSANAAPFFPHVPQQQMLDILEKVNHSIPKASGGLVELLINQASDSRKLDWHKLGCSHDQPHSCLCSQPLPGDKSSQALCTLSCPWPRSAQEADKRCSGVQLQSSLCHGSMKTGSPGTLSNLLENLPKTGS